MDQVQSFLANVRDRLVACERPERVDWPLGSHDVLYYDDDEDGQGPFAVIGASLPPGVFAEIDDGTFGNLHGFRVYLGSPAPEGGA